MEEEEIIENDNNGLLTPIVLLLDINEFDNYINKEIENLLKNLNNNHEIPRSSKIDYLVNQLIEIKKRNPDEKSLIISQWTTLLDIIECSLIKQNFKLLRLDGRQQNPQIRKKIIDEFCNNPEFTLLLTSLKTGGEGLNLTIAKNAFLMDPWWNKGKILKIYLNNNFFFSKKKH